MCTRYKPYWVRSAPKKGVNGTHRESLEFFETWEEAYKFLMDYNQKPYVIKMKKITLEEMFEKFWIWKERSFKTEEQKKKNKSRYFSLFKHFYRFESLPFADFNLDMLQLVIDTSDCASYQQGRIRSLYSQMYEYSKVLKVPGLLEANIADFAYIDPPSENSKQRVLEPEIIKALWNIAYLGNDIAKMVLINLHTGIRPIEFANITEVQENYFVTGSKTVAGANRIIPLHKDIKSWFHELWTKKYFDIFSVRNKYNEYFKELMKSLGFESSLHTCYDCRHTLATKLKKENVEDVDTKLIMGHAIKDIIDKVYVHRTVQDLINSISKINYNEDVSVKLTIEDTIYLNQKKKSEANVSVFAYK